MKIIHCFRAPVGGVFRHVVDLVTEQAKQGHEVGVLCDSSTGGAHAADKFQSLSKLCSLGIHRIRISRYPGVSDLSVLREANSILRLVDPDVVHSHGAKGGMIARVVCRHIGAISVYTPHGGTLHYDKRSPIGYFFLAIEKLLLRRSDGIIFVCDYERMCFHSKVGIKNVPYIVNHNGLSKSDFSPILKCENPSDIIFIGEIRDIKGISNLLNAIGVIKRETPITATIVGDGPSSEKYKKMCGALGLDDCVKFVGALPANEALGLGEIFVLPSLKESFPYVILEAAAQSLPIVATDVGGIKEVLEDSALVPPANTRALADAIKGAIVNKEECQRKARIFKKTLEKKYSVGSMAEVASKFYRSIS